MGGEGDEGDETLLSSITYPDSVLFSSGVNKKPKKFKTVWHGVRGILKLNQASLKLSAGFSNTVCWTS